jgi:hypothetical protein
VGCVDENMVFLLNDGQSGLVMIVDRYQGEDLLPEIPCLTGLLIYL